MRWAQRLRHESTVGGSADRLPQYLRIARVISDEVQQGQLPPGQRLPGSRPLATALGVHRNTALAAYEELTRQGWIESRQGQGTYVCAAVTPLNPLRNNTPRYALSKTPIRKSTYEPPRRNTLRLMGGLPDLRLLPTNLIARAYRRSLCSHQRLDYGDPSGDPHLRQTLSEMLSEQRGLAVPMEQLLVTRGSQLAFYLAARALLNPGDAVAIEEYGYRPIWEVLQRAGAQLIPVPVDRQGMRIDRLVALAEQHPNLRAVYVTPHHQYPTTVTLALPRRQQLLQLASRQGLAILEDDYDHEFQYEGPPVLPIASLKGAEHVVYVGTLSKVLAPGLRIGYVAAAAPLIERMRDLRYYIDRQGDLVAEGAVAELIADGELQRHLWRTRREYQKRRDHCVAQLTEHFSKWLHFKKPHGGLAIWARVPRHIRPPAFAAAALNRSVELQIGQDLHYSQRPSQYLRLGYGYLNEAEMDQALAHLQAVFKQLER